MKFCKLITKYDIAVKLAIKKPKMAANIVCYYNFANKQGIKMLLPVVINKNGKKWTKLADCLTYNAVWLLHGWCHVKLLPPRKQVKLKLCAA